MSQIERRIILFTLISALFVFSTVQAESNDAQTKEVKSYRLTEEKLDQFSNAIKNIAEVIQKNPQMSEDDFEDSDEGIPGMVAIIDRNPQAKKAIEAAGMTSREFVLFELASINGALGDWLSKQGHKIPPEIAPDQVQFYQAHEAKFKAIKAQMDAVQQMLEPDDEEDDSEDEESSEDDV